MKKILELIQNRMEAIRPMTGEYAFLEIIEKMILEKIGASCLQPGCPEPYSEKCKTCPHQNILTYTLNQMGKR